jgi:hypothetical protein
MVRTTARGRIAKESLLETMAVPRLTLSCTTRPCSIRPTLRITVRAPPRALDATRRPRRRAYARRRVRCQWAGLRVYSGNPSRIGDRMRARLSSHCRRSRWSSASRFHPLERRRPRRLSAKTARPPPSQAGCMLEPRRRRCEGDCSGEAGDVRRRIGEQERSRRMLRSRRREERVAVDRSAAPLRDRLCESERSSAPSIQSCSKRFPPPTATESRRSGTWATTARAWIPPAGAAPKTRSSREGRCRLRRSRTPLR